MEPRVKFFQKLRHLAGHLEKETEHLKDIAETKNSDDTSEEGCLSTLHKLKSDVREVKMKMQQGMAKCREEMVQDLSFIEAWTKKREELRDALDTLRIRYEQYGYQPREPAPKPPECEKAGSEGRVEDEEEEEPEQEAGEEEEDDEEAEEDDDGPSEPKKNKPQDECTPDRIAPPSLFQEMSTPKLEDVGLSELHFQNMMKKCAMAGVGQTPMPPSLPLPPVQNRHKPQEERTPDHRDIPSDFQQEMSTPKLEDVGLSERDLQNMLRNCGVAGGEAPLPPPPRIVLSPAATLPPVPKTPKCYLRLDEDMATPRIEDFGISEYTLRLNNDFTMDLLRGQKPAKTASKPHASEVPLLATEEAMACTPVHALYSSQSPQRPGDDLTSPEVPTFQTPYLSRLMSVHKEAKSKDLTSTRMPGLSDSDDGAHLESPHREADDMNSPEVPTFQTPYLSKLMSVHKEAKSKTKDMTGPMAGLSSPHHNTSHHYSAVTEEEDVPGMESRLTCEDDLQRTPEMPVLQSSLGISLQTQYSTFEPRSLSLISRPGEAAAAAAAAAGGPGPCTLDPHETQTLEWSLASPRVRMDYEYDARTPEMPDMSSITQDIFKLVSQCNTEMKSAAAGQPPLLKTAQQTKASGKENRLVTHSQNLALVTEMEFGTLTAYLKQVPLHRLNDAIHEINNALPQRHHGSHSEPREFLTSELRCIMGSGANPSLVMMCLMELKRVKHVHGAGNDALYRLLPTHT